MAMRPIHIYCLIVIVAVALSELICILLSFLRTGGLEPLLLWSGFITPLIDASIVGFFVVYLIRELRNAHQGLERKVEERNLELVVKNRTLEKEIAERKQAEKEVIKFNEELDERVNFRTEELEKACEELKKVDELKDLFLSSVSHELRTPLTSIRSFVEILLDYDDEKPETRKEFLEIIQVESERLCE